MMSKLTPEDVVLRYSKRGMNILKKTALMNTLRSQKRAYMGKQPDMTGIFWYQPKIRSTK